MARKRTPQLTDAERRIMTILWDSKEATVRDITTELEPEHGLAYTTVLTTIGIMADKGYVAFRKAGRAHIYRSLLSREGAQKRALGSLLASLFEGSPQRLAQHLIEDQQLTLEDIDALRAELIARGKPEGEKDQ